MLYADNHYKYRVEKGYEELLLLPEINRFERFLWRIKGYKVTRLPEKSHK